MESDYIWQKRINGYKRLGLVPKLIKPCSTIVILGHEYTLDDNKFFHTNNRLPKAIQNICGSTYTAVPIRMHTVSDLGIPNKYRSAIKNRTPRIKLENVLIANVDMNAYPGSNYWEWKYQKLRDGIKEYGFYDLFDILDEAELLKVTGYYETTYPTHKEALLKTFYWDSTYWADIYEAMDD